MGNGRLSKEDSVKRMITVIDLYCDKGKSIKEISEITGIKESYLRFYLSRNNINRCGYYGKDISVGYRIKRKYIKSNYLLLLIDNKEKDPLSNISIPKQEHEEVIEKPNTKFKAKRSPKMVYNSDVKKPYTIIDKDIGLVLYKGQVAKILNKEELRRLFIEDGILDEYAE